MGCRLAVHAGQPAQLDVIAGDPSARRGGCGVFFDGDKHQRERRHAAPEEKGGAPRACVEMTRGGRYLGVLNGSNTVCDISGRRGANNVSASSGPLAATVVTAGTTRETESWADGVQSGDQTERN